MWHTIVEHITLSRVLLGLGVLIALWVGSRFVRRAAAEALGTIGDPWAVDPLIAALRDERWYVREAAAEALGKIGAPAVDPLIAALRDEYSFGREDAAWALGTIGDPRAVDPLIAALRDELWNVRRAAAEALGEIGDTRAVAPLIAALRDGYWNVRVAAAWALGTIGDPRAVDPLIAALRDERKYVREAAAWALGEIGDTRAVDPLITALRDEWLGVRWAAAVALGKIAPDWPKSQEAKNQVPHFIAALRDKDGDVREAAAKALAKIGDPRAKDALFAALRDERKYVRQAAAVALGTIGETLALEPLIAVLGDKDAQEVHFIAALRDGSWNARQAAAEAVEAIRRVNGQLLGFESHLFCTRCYTRAVRKEVKVLDYGIYILVFCRHCKGSGFLIKGVRRIIGVIGGDMDGYRVDGGRVYVSLWDEEKQEARNADIDILEIRNARPSIHYAHAIASVYTTLYNDISRPRDYVKGVSVVIRADVPLPDDALDLLTRHFGTITYA